MTGWRCGGVCFDLRAPLIMGVVNTTPDSFSDGGCFASAGDAVRRGLQLAEEGAAIVDIGGESTRPGAVLVSAEKEKQRILPVIEQLARRGIVVSADTQKAEVMHAALAAGAAVINDVGGMANEESRAAVANSECGVIIMHMRGNPQTMQTMTDYDNVGAQVGGFLRRRAALLVDSGVDKTRLCVDPGIGFGKTAGQNWQMLRELPQMIGDNDLPVMVGASRKSLFGKMEKDAAKRDGISAVLVSLLHSRRAAHIFRVHNVAAAKSAIAVADTLAGGGLESLESESESENKSENQNC